MTGTPTTSVRIIDVRGDVHPGQLSPRMSRLFDWMNVLADHGGMARPMLLSTCRSEQWQKSMQQQWDAGNREGLAVRPADNSKHIVDAFGYCRAFDLANDIEWLMIMGEVVSRKWPSVEWGGAYLPPDPRHFEER